MSTAAAKLLSEFKALREEEKEEFVQELIRVFPVWDSGALNDQTAASAGDQLATMLEEEERGSKAG